MQRGWVFAGLMIIVGLLPVFGIALAWALAAVSGCTVTQSGARPCVILGLDGGRFLYALSISGWFLILTAPIALAGMALGIWLALVSLIRRARD